MHLLSTRYGRLACPYTQDLIGKSLVMYGEWAQKEIELFGRLISPGSVVLDIGAFVGTHTLAFSRFVGPAGRVHSFEPQSLAVQALRTTVAENELRNVTVHDRPVARAGSSFGAARVVDGNAGGFTLRVADGSEPDAIAALPLDALGLHQCDFIKIDVEGMEPEVLASGEEMLARTRPVIACECNFLEPGAGVLAWASSHGYRTYGILIEAYNPDNFREHRQDMFQGAGEITLLLVPSEAAEKLALVRGIPGMRPVRSLDELGFLLSTKPQYRAEVETLLPTEEGGAVSKPEVRVPARPFVIVVPLYRSPELVRPLLDSLVACAAEITELGGRVVFYNDSPDDRPLREELARCPDASGTLRLSILDNEANLGFIGTVNRAIAAAVEVGEDVLLLNSDTVMFPGTVRELIEVAALDPMIAFVSPRSNNATICTLPHNADSQDWAPAEAHEHFTRAAARLPRYTYVPTAVGFCMHIRHEILSDFGGFDTTYGRGYNEENDLVMRANRCGYRAVLANKAFVWHQGEASFRQLESGRAEREHRNAALLLERYPEYGKLITQHFTSPEYAAEGLLQEGCDIQRNLRVGFDFSDFGTYHNGTFEAGIRLLKAALAHWPSNVQVVVFMDEPAWKFHGLDLLERVWRRDADSPDTVQAVLRMGQPFHPRALRRLFRRAPVAAAFMLDTISADCGYLKVAFDERLWQFSMQWLDVVFTNSAFTAQQFARRYARGEATLLFSSPHSLTPAQYASGEPGRLRPELAEQTGSDYILVIGNKFEHKALEPTIEALAEALPHQRFVALGAADSRFPKVTAVPSGALSDGEIDALYSQARAVVFPSHYEGFGFPVLHALARRRPVYVRPLPPFQEIVGSLGSGGDNVVWYSTTRELVALLKAGPRTWTGGEAAGEHDGWRRSAEEVLVALLNRLEAVKFDRMVERLRWLDATFAEATDPVPVAPIGRKDAMRHLLAQHPLLYGAARLGYRAMKAVRASSARDK